MKTKSTPKPDVVFHICQQMLANSPEASYNRLNPALRTTLAQCISADLPFQPDTFSRIYNELRGCWWFGDGGGSHVGEHYYAHAIGVNHASAYQSFEQFAGRPGVLWEEDANIPVRLHVGSRFTWQGHFVEVTSMRQDRLVACTYKDTEPFQGLNVGATISDYSGRQNTDWVITSTSIAHSTAVLHLQKAKPNVGSRTVARRFTIRYDDIAEFRRTEKARLKKVLAKIAECDPAKDAAALTTEISDEHFRHFQLEEIKTTFNKRKDWVANQGRIEAWRSGKHDAWLDVKENLLRLKDDSVQCSNGNCVSVAAVRRALPILLARRGESWKPNLPLDGRTISKTNKEGVTVGCTYVQWTEIDLLITRHPEVFA